MLAPSSGGLILYQAYGNLYAMTGRKAHYLKDKQILSVGIFDEVFSIWKAFGGNTRDLGSFGEEQDYGPTPTSLKIMFLAAGDSVTSSTRRRHNPPRDGVTTFHDGVRSYDPAQDLEYSLS
ncbi:hypothetical protein Tco_1455629 [Tanacetum coccineum]